MQVRLTILDRDHAVRAIRGPNPFTHLMSFAGSDRERPPDGFENVQHRVAFFFDDITRWRPGWQLPEEEHIKQILRFARAIKERDQDIELLCHCEQGRSRSTAGAFIVLAYLYGPGQEARAMADVVHARSCADPNDLMVEIADRLLKREGSMTRELELARMARRSLPYGSGY